MVKKSTEIIFREGIELLYQALVAIEHEHGSSAAIGCWCFVNGVLWKGAVENMLPNELAEALALLQEGLELAGITASISYNKEEVC